jgi:hypothetical protein
VIAERYLGHLDQVTLASDRPAIDVRVLGGPELRIHPRRGLDIGAAWFRGTPLAWIGPAGEGGGDGGDWRASWGGGLVTTCGLDNVGAPSEGIGLHGTYTFQPACDVEIERSVYEAIVRGNVHDPRGLHVRREIRATPGAVELVDRTVNRFDRPLEAPVLYHVNLGWPLWDAAARVESDATSVRARDAHAEPYDPTSAPPTPAELPERVWEHLGATRASVVNAALGLGVVLDFDLPRLWQWIDPTPGVYALALEPANCSVLGRAHDRAEGRLPFLAPGEERSTRIVVKFEEVR